MLFPSAASDETRRDKHNHRMETNCRPHPITQFKFLNHINCKSDISVQSSQEQGGEKDSLRKLILSESKTLPASHELQVQTPLLKASIHLQCIGKHEVAPSGYICFFEMLGTVKYKKINHMQYIFIR